MDVRPVRSDQAYRAMIAAPPEKLSLIHIYRIMGTLMIEHANAMPAPTWHRLGVNDVDIELPDDLAFARQVEVQLSLIHICRSWP